MFQGSGDHTPTVGQVVGGILAFLSTLGAYITGRRAWISGEQDGREVAIEEAVQLAVDKAIAKSESLSFMRHRIQALEEQRESDQAELVRRLGDINRAVSELRQWPRP